MTERSRPGEEDLNRALGRVESAVYGLQSGLRDVWEAIKTLRNENTSQHSVNLQRMESYQRTTDDRFEKIQTCLDTINQNISERRGAEQAWQLVRHAITAVIASAISIGATLFVGKG